MGPQRTRSVLVIITGGTICMRPRDVCGSRFMNLSCQPLKDYLYSIPEFGDAALPHFDVLEWPTLIDSSDATDKDWARIAEDIERYYEKYDGFVVLHGTDAMAYAASGVSFMLENLGKPVVFTGSMLPIGHIHTDARKNFTASLLVAGFSDVPEVLVVFGNRVLRGCRTTKKSCVVTDAFASPNCHSVGSVGMDIILHRSLTLPPPEGRFSIFTQMNLSSVIVITVTPGLPTHLINHISRRKERPLGIVLQLLGTGTAPTGNAAFIKALEFATANGVTLVAITQCMAGSCSLHTYANGVKLLELGVIEGKDLTAEAALTKLAYLFAKGYKGTELAHLMETSIRGELTERVWRITGQTYDAGTAGPETEDLFNAKVLNDEISSEGSPEKCTKDDLMVMPTYTSGVNLFACHNWPAGA